MSKGIKWIDCPDKTDEYACRNCCLDGSDVMPIKEHGFTCNAVGFCGDGYYVETDGETTLKA